MPPRAWSLRLKDIQQSVTRIEAYIKGLDFAAFSRDQKTVDAVVHNLQIIGEAAINLPDAVARRFPAVPWANIRAMRHILVHGYFTVDLEIVWLTAKHRVPELKRALRRATGSGRRPKK